jgi:dipeptidyl aminopeptidase/acylaminoacyl peptidase
MKLKFSLFFILFYISFILGQDNKDSLIINEWLNIGNITIPFPIQDNKKFGIKDLLSFKDVDINILRPEENKIFSWDKNQVYKWKTVTSTNNRIRFNEENKKEPEVNYLAVYLNADRWLKGKLEINSCQLFNAYIDGKKILAKSSSQNLKPDTSACTPEKSSIDIKLEEGKHLLLLKSLKDPEMVSNWEVNARILLDTPFVKSDLAVSLNPDHFVNIKNLLEDPKIESISISPDGQFASVAISQIINENGDIENWINIYKTEYGSLYRSFKGEMSISSISWAPDNQRFAYSEIDKGKTDLWLYKLEDGTSEKILENIENFNGFVFSPDGSFIIYSINDKAEESRIFKDGLKRFEDLDDRQPDFRKKSFLYLVNIPQKTKRRLTAGNSTTIINDVSSDGKKLLISTKTDETKDRPYSYLTYYILDLQKMESDSLLNLYYSTTASFSPDGSRILFLGGPSLFGDEGNILSRDRIPNDFDIQAYIYDIKTKNVEAISRKFNPSILTAYWSKADTSIYFNTIDKTYQNVYKYDFKNKSYTQVDLKTEVTESINFAKETSGAVYYGSSATESGKFYFVDLKNLNSKLIYDPNKESFKEVRLGKTERWTFKNERNATIDGLVYYPPDFDNNKKYPCIVFYYGGTLPVDQSFEGRYPFNIWAANGFVIYVLQPSGAIGYGQNFSAYHVNDWGKTTAKEIINGTKKFLAAHTFIDPEKVGCIGASYGGFMTENLLTKTNIFTAAISHAGISSIASYWGIGYWGYTYSAVASANSFPWNRKDIYINDSPLFNADKINTPLLLLHGSADTNVPFGESLQLYTALKLLNKKVELIQITGSNHHIMEYKKRKEWTKTIIAWFDKYLKNQPQWWNDLYPGEN